MTVATSACALCLYHHLDEPYEQQIHEFKFSGELRMFYWQQSRCRLVRSFCSTCSTCVQTWLLPPAPVPVPELVPLPVYGTALVPVLLLLVPVLVVLVPVPVCVRRRCSLYHTHLKSNRTPMELIVPRTGTTTTSQYCTGTGSSL
jgi:hypothetical protein